MLKLLSKYFLKSIFQQKLMLICILLITFLSSLFISGIVGYVFSARDSFYNVAKQVNFAEELLDINYWNITHKNPTEVDKIDSVFGTNKSWTNEKNNEIIIKDIFNDPNIANKYPKLAIESFQFFSSLEINYSDSHGEVKTMASFTDNYNNLFKYNSNKEMEYSTDSKREYSKFYDSSSTKDIQTIDLKDKITDDECWVSSSWMASSGLKIGDTIRLNSPAGDKWVFKIQGIANDLTLMSPVDGSPNALFGLPKHIPNLIISHNAYNDIYNKRGSFVNPYYSSVYDFSYRFSLGDQFGQNSTSKYYALDKYIYNKWFTDNNFIYYTQSTTSKLHPRYLMTEYNNSITQGFLSFFLWLQMINIYMIIGIILSVIFWTLAVVILFITLRRIINVNKNRLATLKSLGYHTSLLATGCLVYPILISVVSIILGLSVGYGTQYILSGLYSNAFAFPVHIGFSYIIWIILIGLLFIATNVASYLYNMSQMKKPIIKLFNESNLKAPKLIMALRPVTQYVPFSYKFTLLFALKNWGKILGSFSIMILSFLLLIVSMFALSSSVNINLAIKRGYNFNQSGNVSGASLPIICDNSNNTSGDKNFYIYNGYNSDYTDESNRLVSVGKLQAKFIDLVDKDPASYDQLALNLWTSMKNISFFTEEYFNPKIDGVFKSLANPEKSGIVGATTVGDNTGFVGVTKEEINKLKSLNSTFYFATKNSGTVEEFDDLKASVIKVVQADTDPRIDPNTKRTFIQYIDHYFQTIDFASYHSFGFGFKNISFTNETFNKSYLMTNMIEKYSNGAIKPAYWNKNELKVRKRTVELQAFDDAPYQSYLFDYNSNEFKNILNNYDQGKDRINSEDIYKQFADSHKLITIPIMVNRTWETEFYTSDGAIKEGDYYDWYWKYGTDTDNPYKIRLKIAGVYNSFGPAIAWTTKNYMNILDFFAFNRDAGANFLPDATAREACTNFVSMTANFYENNTFYSNITFAPSFLYMSPRYYGIYQAVPPKWIGETYHYTIANNSVEFFTIGFNYFIKLVEVIFIMVSIFAVLLSLATIYIFFNIIILDDMKIFASMNILGYSNKFSMIQVLKIYLVLIVIITAIFTPLVMMGITKFDKIFKEKIPIDVSLYYDTWIFIFSIVLMFAILFINFATMLLYVIKQKPIKVLAMDS